MDVSKMSVETRKLLVGQTVCLDSDPSDLIYLFLGIIL